MYILERKPTWATSTFIGGDKWKGKNCMWFPVFGMNNRVGWGAINGAICLDGKDTITCLFEGTLIWELFL